ncbi:hypothetical protein [Chryseobacterium chendengshani]|uniref:hypothetical protein n=1 Tax=Chryseobacterium sp. LJ756 TaxID=2864113 RepID=UPI001C6401DC|nr:hypothetical protein [Chryseobacterium sp. LJ756]MBW7675906.1 hypothetical protein [Chryseobacterium sp. LJ756]
MFKKLFISGAFLVPFLFSAQEETLKSESRISIIPAVGYAWRLAKMPSGIPKDTRDYIKGLKTGLNIDVSAYYHFKGSGAIGIKYSNYMASSDGRLTVQGLNGEAVSGFVSTKDNISFVGPAYMFSNFKDDTKHKLFYDIALGVITYTTKTGSVKGTGSNLGLEANFAYQYAITNQIFIGPKLGVTAGTLSKMKYNGTTVNFGEDEGEGLSRLSLSAAVTFRF